QPVSEVAGSWIKQTGYPVLQARGEQHGGEVSLRLSQRRFLYEQLLEESKEDATLWKVPVSISRQGATDKVAVLMEERDLQVPLVKDAATPQGWIKANSGQAGFYRVSYTPENWDRLQDAVQRLGLPAVDRLGLQGDVYALVRAGSLPATRFLSLAQAYKGEEDTIVWSDLATHLYGFETLILSEPYLPGFDRFARELFQQIVQKVGWDAKPGEGHLDSLRRSVVLGQAGAYGEPGVLREAQARFAAYLRDASSLHPDLRGVVIALAAQQGDQATYDTLWDLAKRTELQEEKLRFLRALGNFPQRELLQTTLDRSLSADVRIQDSVMVIGAVSSNRQGRQPAWEFIKANWDELDRRYGRGGFAIASLVALTNGFTTLEKAAEVEAFFKTHPAPSAARAIQQALERIRLNAKWLDRNRQDLAAWFSARSAMKTPPQ
ncbi:MAG TPA: ERAP1-like C-terminal domain-containing protein, partial [Dehalococcoidia bacterium]|nr:ERAP1-like C-terminal domain-containing protein [Dehalococcoidia bacterium]